MKLDPTVEEAEDPATAVDEIKEETSAKHIEKVFLDLDSDGASTLVGGEPDMVGEKEIEMEVTDSEGEQEQVEQDGPGIKRKRTIRVIIRSRAFI